MIKIMGFYSYWEIKRMERQLYTRHLSGIASEEVREYEIEHRKLARRAASDGMVLLKNDNNLLPLAANSKIALYGPGAIHMIKGGTGSGDVNQRELIEIWDGFKSSGFEIVNEKWLEDYINIYNNARLAWRDDLLKQEAEGGNLFELYAGNPLPTPKADDPKKEDTDTAFYILSRVSGEGADRRDEPGDFRISDEEKDFLSKLNKIYNHIVLVLNIGGLMDLSFIDELSAIEAVIYMMQPGMEGGLALADIVLGKVTPSGKLTDTWAYNYRDYPSTKTFSKADGCTDYEEYAEGIYVGYRYFDTFSVSVRYGFGFGLSYTSFSVETEKIELVSEETRNPRVAVTVNVTNTGDTYAGREVVQIYASCPDGKLEKEHRRLAGFAKTKHLGPGMSEKLTVTFPIYALSSYDESLPGYILEGGYYGIWVGNSLGDSKLKGMIRLDNCAVLRRTDNICPVQNEFEQLKNPGDVRATKYRAWVEKGKAKNLPIIRLSADTLKTTTYEYGVRSKRIDPDAKAFVDSLSLEQLIKLSTGDPGRAENNGDNVVGAGGVSVPGSAAETSRCAIDKGLGSMVLTDGPAGLRLDKGYVVSKDGEIERREFIDVIEDGLFSKKERVIKDSDTIYHQYCTAFPIGTVLAQTWDTELVSEVGHAVGEEMMLFQTSLWLAPGMNIHRNPLCGRNFEYYSEDPLVAGVIAAAMTSGVQSVGGCGTTIKHYACNNQEENRLHCDSRVYERALREIYLKGFEICIKASQPMAIMTSYNLINNVHTANSYDLCSKAARDEWRFAGMIMTDWTTTEHGPDCTASGCMRAGNDLVCPGNKSDHDNIKEELEAGTLNIEELKACVARTVQITWQSNAYVDAPSYNSQFVKYYKFMDVLHSLN